MIKSLILVRHAKAETRSPEIEDHERQLTSAGIRSAKAAIPRTFTLVERPDEHHIWSSPAVRARQTAEIVADAMGLSEIEEVPALYSDEVMAVRQMLDEEKGDLVVVGHNPFLEELSNTLTPVHLKFGKCAAACYIFPKGDLQSAELSWFVQGPDPSRWETLVDMEAALSKAGRRVSGATWAFFDDPKNPEYLHEVRAALRDCLTLLDFAQPWLKAKCFNHMHEAFASFYNDTSDLRALAIPSRTAEQYRSIPFVTPEAQRMYDRLRVMEATRNRTIVKLQTPARQKAFHAAIQSLREPAWKGAVEADGVEKAELKRRFKKTKRAVKQQRLEFEALADSDKKSDAALKLKKSEDRLKLLASSLPCLYGQNAPEDSPEDESVEALA